MFHHENSYHELKKKFLPPAPGRTPGRTPIAGRTPIHPSRTPVGRTPAGMSTGMYPPQTTTPRLGPNVTPRVGPSATPRPGIGGMPGATPTMGRPPYGGFNSNMPPYQVELCFFSVIVVFQPENLQGVFLFL